LFKKVGGGGFALHVFFEKYLQILGVGPPPPPTPKDKFLLRTSLVCVSLVRVFMSSVPWGVLVLSKTEEW